MRLGLATASCFGKIVTPAKGEPSKQMDDYANDLIGELVTGNNSETFTSYWMERGQLFEADAAAAYEFITGFELDRGGFLTDDDMTVGASPDRRVIKLGSVIGGVETHEREARFGMDGATGGLDAVDDAFEFAQAAGDHFHGISPIVPDLHPPPWDRGRWMETSFERNHGAWR